MFSSNPPSGAPSLAPLPSSLAETVSRLELPSARGSGGSESRNTPVHTPPCAKGRDPDPREGRAPANGCDAPRSVGLDAGASPRSSALGAPPGRGRDSDHSPSPSMAAGGAGARSGRPGLWRAHRTAAPRAIPPRRWESANPREHRERRNRRGDFGEFRDFRERSRPAWSKGPEVPARSPRRRTSASARFFARAGGFPRAALGGTPARAALAATPPREPRAAPRARGAMRLREHVRALAAGLEKSRRGALRRVEVDDEGICVSIAIQRGERVARITLIFEVRPARGPARPESRRGAAVPDDARRAIGPVRSSDSDPSRISRARDLSFPLPPPGSSGAIHPPPPPARRPHRPRLADPPPPAPRASLSLARLRTRTRRARCWRRATPPPTPPPSPPSTPPPSRAPPARPSTSSTRSRSWATRSDARAISRRRSPPRRSRPTRAARPADPPGAPTTAV